MSFCLLHFCFRQEGVRLLDPQLRSFNELRAWLDRQAAALANRRVLMYCTGGVRCERASAYLRSKGPAFHDVVQLSGTELFCSTGSPTRCIRLECLQFIHSPVSFRTLYLFAWINHDAEVALQVASSATWRRSLMAATLPAETSCLMSG